MTDFLSPDHALHLRGRPFRDALGGATALDFWRWAFSDVLLDTLRGSFAEFIVARLLGETNHVPPDTTEYDIETDGDVRIEVKSTAFVQRWISLRTNVILGFSGLKRKPYNYETGEYGDDQYLADIYVFCVLAEKERADVDLFNLAQWEFYVVGREVLKVMAADRSYLSLTRLRRHVKPCGAEELATAVKAVSSV